MFDISPRSSLVSPPQPDQATLSFIHDKVRGCITESIDARMAQRRFLELGTLFKQVMGKSSDMVSRFAIPIDVAPPCVSLLAPSKRRS